MAGRHRRTPAWRRLLLRLRRSDRAARTAALQAEVVALRATVRALRAELDTAWELAAAAAVARTTDAARWELELPLVQAALAPAEVASTRAAGAATPVLAGVRSIVLDLRPDSGTTQIVLADPTNVTVADLPESVLLDPKQSRDAEVIDVSEPATVSGADTTQQARRTA